MSTILTQAELEPKLESEPKLTLNSLLFDGDCLGTFHHDLKDFKFDSKDHAMLELQNIWVDYIWPTADLKASFEKLISIVELESFASLMTGEKGIIECCRQHFQKKITHEKARDILVSLTWITLFLHSMNKQTVTFDQKETSLLQQALRDIIEIADEELLFNILKIFGSGIQKDRHLILNSLQKMNKQRYYTISLALYSLFKTTQKESAGETKELAELSKIRVVLNHKLYREGVYNRSALLALVTLAQVEMNFDSKLKLINQCYDRLCKQNDKTEHLKTWDILRTLLCCNLSESIEKFLISKHDKPFTFQELYWHLFKEIFNLGDEDYALYSKQFNHPLHHLLLGFRQNMIQGNRYLFDDFIKSTLKYGIAGYHSIRYENRDNLHLNCVFANDSGNHLRYIWRQNHVSEAIQTGILTGCKVYNTDDYWKILTWGIGLNCLDPLAGKIYFTHHLFDGQNRLLLLVDEHERPIAGCIFHLLLRGETDPKPVLALSPIYILHSFGEHIDTIRVALDSMAAKIALQTGLPLFAFQGGKFPDRIQPKILEKSDAIFTIPGFIKNGARTGIDELSSPENRRDMNGNSYYHNYQELYLPSDSDRKQVHEQKLKYLQECISNLVSSHVGTSVTPLVMGYLFDHHLTAIVRDDTDTSQIPSPLMSSMDPPVCKG